MLSNKTKKILKWFLVGFIFLILLLALAIGFFEYRYINKYYPGVTINGKSVAGKTYEQVIQEFRIKSDNLQKNGLTLIFNVRGNKTELNIPSTTTGLTPDILIEYFSANDFSEPILQSYNWGRTGNILQRLKEQFDLFKGKNFIYSISTHKEAIESLISNQKKYFFDEEVPAQFSVDNNNEVTITPERIGDDIDVKKITEIVLQKLNTFETEPIIFDIKNKNPYPTEQKLKPFLSFAKEIKNSANINFYYDGHKWKVSGKTLVTWLTLKSDKQITVDNKKLKLFLSDYVLPFVNDPPQNSRFEMKDGKLTEIFAGKSGNTVDVNKILSLLEKEIYSMQQSFSTTINIPIETIIEEPKVTQKTIDQYKIEHLLGRAQTNFAGGSLDRQHNIEVGVSKISGILIAPGEEFSTVKAIGDITKEAGFLEEYVINQNQTVKELGGGLCQLATTLFRTALNAGLPITERVNHKYVIPYYGPGVDATIYGPHPDFRFVNDTENYLLLQGTAKNNEAVFELYGVLDGRKAEVSTPLLSNEKPVPPTRYIMTKDLPAGKTKCQTTTHKGITADTTYTVIYPNNSKKETIFHSVYEPWPKVCLVGTSLDK